MNSIKEMNINDSIYRKLQKAGLCSKSNMESLIALIDKTKSLTYYSFPLIKKEIFRNNALTKYDIPQYIKGMPDGYSIICTIEEAAKIRNYEKKIEKKEVEKNDIEKTGNYELDDDFFKEPEPKKNNNYCHICRKKFDNYLKHIETDFHKKNTNNHFEAFKNIKNCFSRVNNFWKENKVQSNENQKLQTEENINTSNNDEENENKNKFELKISSQLSIHAYNIKEGCQQKKKFIPFTSELSTDTSFNPIQGKKRKKNEFQKQYEAKESKSEKKRSKAKCRLPTDEYKKQS